MRRSWLIFVTLLAIPAILFTVAAGYSYVYYLIYRDLPTYQRWSGNRRYVVEVGPRYIHFSRTIRWPNEPQPVTENGVVSMGRELAFDDYLIAEWRHDYRDAYFSKDLNEVYDATRPGQLAGLRRVIESDGKVLSIDLWWCVPALAPIPIIAGLRVIAIRRARRRALAATRCLRCGYDLRASPLRCPECGASVPRDKVDVVSTREG